MTEQLIWNGNTLWTAPGSNYVLIAEQDVDGRTHTIERFGDRYIQQYRDTQAEAKTYTAVMQLVAGGGYTLTDLIAQWKAWHAINLGIKTLERVTENGVSNYLDCVAQAPELGDEGINTIEVTQAYTAPTPFWRGAEVNVAANFDGTTPVSLAFDNTGALPAWVRLVIAGPVSDPRVALGTTWEIEFSDLDLASGDVLAINCQTPASAWYTPSGGSATRAYGYRTAATSFRLAKLPVGEGALTLSAASGTGLCTVYWSPLYEALQ
jgi:hypothetical protein